MGYTFGGKNLRFGVKVKELQALEVRGCFWDLLSLFWGFKEFYESYWRSGGTVEKMFSRPTYCAEESRNLELLWRSYLEFNRAHIFPFTVSIPFCCWLRFSPYFWLGGDFLAEIFHEGAFLCWEAISQISWSLEFGFESYEEICTRVLKNKGLERLLMFLRYLKI